MPSRKIDYWARLVVLLVVAITVEDAVASMRTVRVSEVMGVGIG
jgi:hypothetical protein